MGNVYVATPDVVRNVPPVVVPPDQVVVLARSSGVISHTTAIAEETLVTINLPALGPNDALRVFYRAQQADTATAGNRPLRVYLGATIVHTQNATITNTNIAGIVMIVNNGATNDQVCSTTFTGGVGPTGSTGGTAAEQTNAGTTLRISGQTVTATDNFKLQAYYVEHLKGT